MNNLFAVNSAEAMRHIETCFRSGLVPFLTGSPGAGKSAIYSQVADNFGLELIDLRLSMLEPSDLQGLPDFVEGKAEFKPFSLFPLQDTPLPEGKNGWCLLLDEFNSAPRDTLAAAYKVVLDRMVGMNKLHDNCVIACAGNLDTDNAITNNIGTALQSRLVHFELKVSLETWMQAVALPEGYDERIIAYLNYEPSKLMNFRPDHTDVTYACPRSWSFVNRYVGNFKDLSKITPLIVGTIGSEVGNDFIKFSEIWDRLIKIEDVLADPHTCRVPDAAAEKWATITHLVGKSTKDNFDKVAIYLNRYSLDFKVLAGLMLVRQKPEVTYAAGWSTIISSVGKRIAELEAL